jgi:hypothetical protein
MSIDTATKTASRLDQFLSEDRRYYVFGEGDTQERFLRVSTALELVGDKDGLQRWGTGLTADAALNELPKLIRATRTQECGNTYKRCQHDHRQQCATCPCQKCYTCVRKWLANRHYAESARRADEGTRVHDVAEWWVLNGGAVRGYDPDIAVYVEQWLKWAADYGLTPDSWELSEATVINRTHGYAGTLDGIITFRADATRLAAELVAKVLQLLMSQVAGKSIRMVVDVKSREKEEARLYEDHALQQAGYRFAEVVRLRDGREFPMPATDGAVIVQVRPDGYLCEPVVADEVTFQEGFLSGLRHAKWHFALGTASVSPRSFKIPKEPGKASTATVPCPVCEQRGAVTIPAWEAYTDREWDLPSDAEDDVLVECPACNGAGTITTVAPAKTARKAATPRKTTAKTAPPKKAATPRKTVPARQPDPEAPQRPVRVVAKEQSAILASVKNWPTNSPHPNSPYGDDIPF